MREDISSLKISLIGGGGEGSNLLMNSSLNIPYFFFEVVPYLHYLLINERRRITRKKK